MSLDERVEVPSFASVTFPEPAHAVLDLRRVGRGIEVTGTIDVVALGPCDRCLDETRVPIAVEVDERFDPISGAGDPLAENNVLDGTHLDAGDLVRQLVQTALPYGMVCREDCKGLCDRCGRSRNDGGCTCPPEVEG